MINKHVSTYSGTVNSNTDIYDALTPNYASAIYMQSFDVTTDAKTVIQINGRDSITTAPIGANIYHAAYTGKVKVDRFKVINACNIAALNYEFRALEFTVLTEPRCDTPTGTYNLPRVIKLYDQNPAAQSTIYYTTNGSTPTINSTAYNATTGITINATTTVKAVSIAAGFATSDVTSVTITKA